MLCVRGPIVGIAVKEMRVDLFDLNQYFLNLKYNLLKNFAAHIKEISTPISTLQMNGLIQLSGYIQL